MMLFEGFTPPPWFWYMILIDALIAFIIPVWVWWRQIRKKITVFAGLLDEHLIQPLKDDIKNDMRKMLKKELKKLLNNEIPHCIGNELGKVTGHLDNQIEILKIYVRDQMETVKDYLDKRVVDLKADMHTTTSNIDLALTNMKELKDAMYRALGNAGQAGKQRRQMERLMLEKHIVDSDPQKEKAILGLRLAKKSGFLGQKEYDMALAYMSGGMNGMLGGTQVGPQASQGLPVFPYPQAQLDEGSEQVPQEVGENAGRQEEMAETQLVASQRKALKNELEKNLPKEVVKEILKEGDEANKRKQEKEGSGENAET